MRVRPVRPSLRAKRNGTVPPLCPVGNGAAGVQGPLTSLLLQVCCPLTASAHLPYRCWIDPTSGAIDKGIVDRILLAPNGVYSLSDGRLFTGSRVSPRAQTLMRRCTSMPATAWFWSTMFIFVLGIGVVSHGFYLMSRDGRLGLRFISFGSAIVMLGLAATFLHL